MGGFADQALRERDEPGVATDPAVSWAQDRGNPAPWDPCTERGGGRWLPLSEQLVRVFEECAEALQEARARRAVDDAVVDRQGKGHE